MVPNGSKIPVTNKNRLHYLDALAQHKLANSVKAEISSFLKGLNELIPDNLLSIFDENELEVCSHFTVKLRISLAKGKKIWNLFDFITLQLLVI